MTEGGTNPESFFAEIIAIKPEKRREEVSQADLSPG